MKLRYPGTKVTFHWDDKIAGWVVTIKEIGKEKNTIHKATWQNVIDLLQSMSSTFKQE